MESPSPFKFPTREPAPLLPLSPERVNASRPMSAVSTTATSRSFKQSETESQDVFASPYGSPSRKARANLFADYKPQTATPASKATGFALPQSPSLPEINALRSHVRTNSDVQGLVKRFEHLDVRDRDAESVERRKRHEAELRRAQIAREEAESDARRLREEVRRLRRECEDERERERKVGRRLEVVMEDFGAAKDAHASQSALYEKEVRKARKEAFKSSSAVLKLQEELKSTRNSLRITQSGFELERQKVQKKEQERFEMEYQLIPLQEEMDQLKHRLKVAEEEREALKTNLKEEEVARIAAEGMIALPSSQDQDDDLFTSPRKQSPQKRAASPLSDDKENMHVTTKKALENRHLSEELQREKARRENAEELADFLQMECKFRCCGCKTASRLGHEFVLTLDAELAAGVQKVREGMEGILSPPGAVETEEEMEVETTPSVETEATTIKIEAEVKMEDAAKPEARAPEEGMAGMADELDRSVTLAAESPKQPDHRDEQLLPEAEQKALKAASPSPIQLELKAPAITSTTETAAVAATAVTVPLQPSTPPAQSQHHATPFRHQPSIRTVTTTTTVPMQFTPVSKPTIFSLEDAENIPPSAVAGDDGVTTSQTFDRAAALAAIEYRRGRAKSIANGHVTPRKQMMEGVKERRDISAPALGQQVGGSKVITGVTTSGSVGRAGGRRMGL